MKAALFIFAANVLCVGAGYWFLIRPKFRRTQAEREARRAVLEQAIRDAVEEDSAPSYRRAARLQRQLARL